MRCNILPQTIRTPVSLVNWSSYVCAIIIAIRGALLYLREDPTQPKYKKDKLAYYT